MTEDGLKNYTSFQKTGQFFLLCNQLERATFLIIKSLKINRLHSPMEDPMED